MFGKIFPPNPVWTLTILGDLRCSWLGRVGDGKIMICRVPDFHLVYFFFHLIDSRSHFSIWFSTSLFLFIETLVSLFKVSKKYSKFRSALQLTR